MHSREEINRIIAERKIEKNIQIFEMLEPGQIYALTKDDDGILFIGNEKGKPFVEKIYYKEP